MYYIFKKSKDLRYLQAKVKDLANMPLYNTFQGNLRNEQSLASRQPFFQSVHMLNWKYAHAQLRCACAHGTKGRVQTPSPYCSWTREASQRNILLAYFARFPGGKQGC